MLLAKIVKRGVRVSFETPRNSLVKNQLSKDERG